MKFPLSFTWSYDPFGKIYKLRVENKITPYVDTQKPEIVNYMDQDEWEDNTLQEAKEKLLPTSTSQTPTPLVKKRETSKVGRLSFSHRDFNQRIQDLEEERKFQT